MSRVPSEFFQQKDTIHIAQSLIGKVLRTEIDGYVTSGIIIETEAYLGKEDRASHAFGGRRTKRTEVMYKLGGHIYVYLCYGMHHLFNVVTGPKDDPQAVLVRNIEPYEGLSIMKKRRNVSLKTPLLSGPGTLTEALGINMEMNGISLNDPRIGIFNRSLEGDISIRSTARIGIDYAGKDAALSYRFIAEIKS